MMDRDAAVNFLIDKLKESGGLPFKKLRESTLGLMSRQMMVSSLNRLIRFGYVTCETKVFKHRIAHRKMCNRKHRVFVLTGLSEDI